MNHPGAINTYDSQTYDSLLVCHSIIETTKADLAAGKFPINIVTGVKNALNDLIRAYDVADITYLAYHQAAAAGTVTAAQQAAVNSAMTVVNNSTVTLTSARGGK